MATDIAQQHTELAAQLAAVADNVHDWDGPSPVKEWRVRDVIEHLVTWLPQMLGGVGVELPTVTVGDDPAAAFRAHSGNVQQLLDNDELSAQTVDVGQGPQTVAGVIERFYLPDLFMHRWDLATASGQDPQWDPATVRGMVEGMTPMRDYLASSGQFGEPVVLDESHSDVDRLVALIGRDPDWTPHADSGAPRDRPPRR